jgi:oligopeptide/dipeptide ABC transporter ATP-binding protein
VSAPLLQVMDLTVEYSQSGRRPPFRAVDGVSFELAAGETLGLVGESGSGKSTVGKALLHLTPVHSGRIAFEGRDITYLSGKDRRGLSSAMQVVFQDPYSSFNPSRTIGDSLREMLRPQGIRGRGVTQERAVGLMERVGLDASALDRYPGAFSGGQRQRIAIARALMVDPKLLICDEAVSALDLSVQAQVINLLSELQQERGISLLFISHDLAVVNHVSQRVMVLYKGRVMETGDTNTVYSRPQNPYTRVLLDAVPVPDPVLQRQRRASLLRSRETTFRPTGCPFANRCAFATEICESDVPVLEPVPGGSMVACHHWQRVSETLDPASAPTGRAALPETRARRTGIVR